MITLTEAAAAKVKALRLEEGQPDWGLRLRVVGGGCSGFSYELGWEDAAQQGDQVIDASGVKVYVDEASTPHLEGAEVDYVDGLAGSGFSIRNPNAVGSCACGHSSQA